MSQYSVEHRLITRPDVWMAADILWAEHRLLRDQHPWLRFRRLLEEELTGTPGLLCYCDGYLVGALSMGPLEEDYHITGQGIIVYATMTSCYHPKATRLLYRHLAQLVKDGGGSWYQTTRRVSETEFRSRYRRIPNG